MKTATVATIPALFPADEPTFTIGQHIRLVGVDRHVYTIARRRKLDCASGSPGKTWEYLLHDLHGRPATTVYEDKLRAVETGGAA